jgi:hypothetical protein
MSAIMTKTASEAALRLGTLIEAHARDAGRQLGEWLRPWLREGEVLPDFTLVLLLPARMIGHAGKRLRESQRELDESRSQENEARVSRDLAASALRRKLVEVRRHLTAVFGSRRSAALLGIEGTTAKASQSALLLSQAEAFLRLLHDRKRLVVSNAGPFVPASAAATLEPLSLAFHEARNRLDEIRRASAARLETRDQARIDLERGLHCVACILGGWLDLIRRADLAEKLRLVPRT